MARSILSAYLPKQTPALSVFIQGSPFCEVVRRRRHRVTAAFHLDHGLLHVDKSQYQLDRKRHAFGGSVALMCSTGSMRAHTAAGDREIRILLSDST